jgi:parallel beta-helix repeat protein
MKRIVSGIMLALLLMGMFSLSSNIKHVKSEPRTIIVPDDYPTIQEAINAASSGDIIYVKAGTYYESITINKPLSLEGEDAAVTIIDARGAYIAIFIDFHLSDVTIKRFTIKNAIWYGILPQCGNRLIIEGNRIINNGLDGIFLHASNSNVTNNIIANNGRNGIYLEGGNNFLRNNTLWNNTYNFGVNVFGEAFFQDIDDSNTIDGKPIYYWVNRNSGQVPSNASYVAIVNSTNIVVQNLKLEKNLQGVLLAFNTNCVIKNVTMISNGVGLEITESTNITAKNNTLLFNDCGVFLLNSGNSTVAENKIVRSKFNLPGEINPVDGVAGFGVYLTNSSNNKIYHNAFIDNLRSAFIEPFPTPPSINTWDDDYPSSGNYWSDYTGIDLYSGPYQNETGSDGIGDTPYTIDANNVDRYPLMNPWGAGTPVANFSWSPSIPEVGELVTFDASASKPIGGEIISYEWDFGDGSRASGKIVTHRYATIGAFTVTLNVTDSEGLWDIEQKQMEVKAPPPPLTVTISPMSALMLVGQSVTFTSTVSGGYPPYSYQWFLNGNPVSGAISNNWTFTPITSGIFYIHLKVTDDKGNTAQSDAARIVVSIVPVGGYSIPLQPSTKTNTTIPYTLLVTVLTAIFITIKRKYKRTA